MESQFPQETSINCHPTSDKRPLSAAMNITHFHPDEIIFITPSEFYPILTYNISLTLQCYRRSLLVYMEADPERANPGRGRGWRVQHDGCWWSCEEGD